MSRKPVFFLPEPREPNSTLQDLLAPHGEIRVGGTRKLSEEELVRAAPEWDALLATSRDRFTSRVFEAARRLKIVAKFGVGVENIDLAAATRCGVPVTNCPGTNAVAVAEAALGLMVSASRRIPQSMRHLQEGGWRDRIYIANEMSGATFGIVGFGHIGREFRRLLLGFQGRVLVHDPYVSADGLNKVGAEMVDLDTLCHESDFISLHCSLTPQTHHMFTARRLATMKPNAVPVNCARGGLIDEAALVEALREGRIAAAGLDVFGEEPPRPDNPLFSLPNVVVTPHLAGGTHQARERINRMIADNVIRVLRGERIDSETLLNPEVCEVES